MDACVDWAQGFPLTYPEPDGYAVAISRGVSAVGGATDFCFDNLAAAWPLILETGRTAAGRAMLSEAFRTCKPLKTFEEVQGLLVRAAPTPPLAVPCLLSSSAIQLGLRKVLAQSS